MSGEDGMDVRLASALQRVMSDVRGVEGLKALSGGAMQETWFFTALTADGSRPLILRRARGRLRSDRTHGIDLATEAAVARLAEAGGVPVPHVHLVLDPSDGLGEGFVMDFIEGETIPRRILRDAEYAQIRPRLARECGTVLGHIHKLDTAGLEGIEALQPRETIARMREAYEVLGAPCAVFELAFRWLADNMPADMDQLSLVHADFRNGNLLIGPDRLRAVLDWESAHIGDPHEDLGYIALTSWRFGELDKPIGGFGSRDDFYAAYEQVSGTQVSRERAHFWEVAFTLNWGIQCAQMAKQFLDGTDNSVERGAIGRRRSETELDLLELLDGARHA